MWLQLGSVLLLVFGFGFVIFWHELGHFLAAKWVGIKVEQFAVGFGQALVAWRKGIGFRLGSTQNEYENRARQHLQQETQEVTEWEPLKIDEAARYLGLGETEYRLNWIPLGGYVKMLGQDDLRPNARSEDPRSYNRKSIGARMVVVSAGVLMNILLAAIGFMLLFLIGFRVQPAVVGSIQALSPAQKTVNEKGEPAPLAVGDRILMFDGKWQHDFTKITLNVALSSEEPTPMYVERVNGKKERLFITPQRSETEGNFLMIGVGAPADLRGPDKTDKQELEKVQRQELVPDDMMLLDAGDVIIAVNDQPVQAGDEKNGKGSEYYKLDRAVQASDGKEVYLTIRRADGKVDKVGFTPHFMTPFNAQPLSFAGMLPRASIWCVNEDSPARTKLMPDDVIVQIAFSGGTDPTPNPTAQQLIEKLNKAGSTGQTVDLIVLRKSQEKILKGLTPTVRVAKDRYGLSVALSSDDRHAVVAGVEEKSPAKLAGIPIGAQITAIDGQPVVSWFDVKRLLAATAPNAVVKVTASTATGSQQFELKLNEQQIGQVAALNYTHYLPLHERIEPRKTSSPLTAAAWGITETRDFILQFYLTLHRMFTGSVSYKNMMGPVGIFNAGRRFAIKGTDWLIWFLSMISANLAVVNFLPIPIVDGGLFTFLIIEKIQGRPLSPKTQSIAQVVGLAIILSVFLLVTYQDVARMAAH